MNESIQKLFGEESLTFGELVNRADAAGVRIGDLGEAEAAHKAALNEVRISHALERGLERAGAKNGELVKRAIRMDAVRVEDGCVKGLDEQLAALQESDPYLFREREVARTGASHGTTAADPDGMSDAEFYRMRMKG